MTVPWFNYSPIEGHLRCSLSIYWGSSREPQVRKKAEHKGLGEGDLEKL